MKRMALTSSSSASFLPFANPEKGDPNAGMSILLSYFFPSFRLKTNLARRGLGSDTPWSALLGMFWVKHATFQVAISQGSLPRNPN
jgi:hypothetical protein